ncbi:MAG: hypothetical protein ACRDFX_14265 [Chloroflexota bacterium]
MSFGTDYTSGLAYIAYAAEDITYPPRPARSYLHGPFTRARIAMERRFGPLGSRPARTVRITLIDRALIHRLVAAVNNVKGYRTAFGVCAGGFSRDGPAWISFVRPNGSVSHAFESGPGGCGELAVNHVRGLLDRGAVWNQLLSFVSHAAGPSNIHPSAGARSPAQ